MYSENLREQCIYSDNMAYDSFNYDIKSKMPLWWQEDTFLEPINRYSQELLKDLIGGFLTNLGIVQPVQVWKTLPTEYSWIHTYIEHDPLLQNSEGGTVSKQLKANTPIRAYIPNSKRNCHGEIQLRLTGDNNGLQKPLKKLVIRNAHQKIILKNITTTSDIKISTESQSILVDGVYRSDLIEGEINKIYSQPKNNDYSQLDIEDENKTTYIEIESDANVSFDLKIKHIHPIYVTEQNIRLYTVSAFPLEYVKLYGFFCHDFNNQQEWRFLWEKHYDEDERVVFDRITKQFNCETFYIQVKYHGIGVPLTFGFPQEEASPNPAFSINKVLDKWGRILGLPRRYYKNNITDDEEPYTYPPFYKYNIEQDYWYEQRLINEYRYNEDAINASYIKDSNLNNVALLYSIDPFIQDVYVYTETIAPTLNNDKEVGYINPSFINESGEGVSWRNPHQIANTNFVGAELTLEPKTSSNFNDKESYQTKVLEVRFDEIPEIPKNVEITGIELRLNGATSIHSDSLQLDDRSNLILPTYTTLEDGVVKEGMDIIPIALEDPYWQKEKGVYIIGGKNNLFGLDSIDQSQISNGFGFEIAFTNTNEFLKSNIILYNIQLFIYYTVIYDKYDINVRFDTKTIVLDDEEQNQIKMHIDLKNTGEIPIVGKNIYIAVPPEIEITNKTFPPIDLDIGEPFTIGELDDDQIIITCPKKITGLYDVIVFCDDDAIKNEIVVKETDINNIDSIYGIETQFNLNPKMNIGKVILKEKSDNEGDTNDT